MCPPSRIQVMYSQVVSTFVKNSLILLIVAISACGNTPPSPSAAVKHAVSTPADLLTPHVLTVGSYINYLPQEFVDPRTSQPTGFDMDMINALAQTMNLKVSFVNENFSDLLNDLLARRFDVAISAVVITPDLQKKVAFIPYLKSGESLLVASGDPLHIHGISDLCGHMVAVKKDSVEYNELNVESGNCQRQGLQVISLVAKDSYPDLIHSLDLKSADSIYLDLSQADYYMKLYPGDFDIAGPIINPGIEGIAIRLNDSSMLHSFQSALNQLKNNGTYQTIAQRWGLTNSELSSHSS